MLVTGGAGFIGSHLIRRLLASGSTESVVNLDLLTYAGDLRRLDDLRDDPRLETVVGDVCDAGLVAQIMGDLRVDGVVHLAAESHVDRSIAGPATFVRTNVTGTLTLLEAARATWSAGGRWRDGVRFLHVSTDEVYGDLGPSDPPFTEESPYAPGSPYSASKAGADHLVRAYHHTWELPVLVTQSSNNYGPFQHGEKFIPTVIRSCLEGLPIPLYGDGSNVRDWLHVEDHCTALEAVLLRGRPGRSYLVGAGNERTNLQVVRSICSIMDDLAPAGAPHARLISFVADRPGHDRRYALDSRRLQRELGWMPVRAFEEGLADAVVWYARRGVQSGEHIPPGRSD